MRKLRWILASAFLGIVAFHTLVAILLCEGTVRLKHKALTGKMCALAESGARQFDAKLDAIQISSFDGARLSAWFFRPQDGNGDAVILLHGHGDNRAGMLSFVPMFLRRHYAVLVPDARAHGECRGDLATFGIDESRDLSRWVDWLSAQDNAGCVYALGESMGAAILLQALSKEPRFCAVAAESPFASFREAAYDRLGQKFGGGAWAGRTLFGPLVSEAFIYARWRYGVDFNQDSPANSGASTRVPILLIHGTEDFNIPVRHCEAILKNHNRVIEFWAVPGAGHTGAFGHCPEEFERRVTDWSSRYSHK